MSRWIMIDQYQYILQGAVRVVRKALHMYRFRSIYTVSYQLISIDDVVYPHHACDCEPFVSDETNKTLVGIFRECGLDDEWPVWLAKPLWQLGLP
jgi:hypothetical protein